MPKILRNYIVENGKIKLCDWRGVFEDVPMALCDFGRDYTDPILIDVDLKKDGVSRLMIFERAELIEIAKRSEVENNDTSKEDKQEKGDA